ncbi:fibronectin type III domain-containing protein [Arabiibacter massiliensis]|uniref:fibronectin type III domain-containing protein n=1 Tax=Arabiibacter massiliensis TaxID=1870985 RepID=UPI0009BB6ADD|nr:fibronectin type III domain-containing protein [Arabiibacter massiliensis]
MQWSGANQPYGDQRALYAGVEAWVSRTTDTQVWVSVRGVATSGSGWEAAYQYGVYNYVGYYYESGGYALASDSASGVLNGTSWVADYTREFGPFDRRSAAYSLKFFSWVRGTTVSGYGAWAGSAEAQQWVTIPALPVYAPAAPTGVSNTRQSDNRNVVSWTNHPDATHPYDAVKVERAVDGGSWSQIASLSGSATSYADASISPNHAYAYRVRAANGAGHSAYATSATTYNTPAAPTGVTAARSAETTVALSIENPALTATALELQRSSDASAWTTVKTVEGSAVAEAQDAPGGGTFYYRARNTRGSLASAWSPASNKVVTIVAPAAPTPVAPASGMVVPKSQESVAFSWRHNPIDGSEQTAAQVQHSVDGGSTWTTVQAEGEAQQKSVANAWPVNATVSWRVRTKGAHADYGAWSSVQAFRVCQVPTVVISTPAADGAVIDDVPVRIAWTYADESGTQQRATLSISDAQGATLWSAVVQGDAASVSVSSAELLPENNAIFSIALTAYSTSGLSTSATRTFATDYEEPPAPEVRLEVDSANGRVAATVFEGTAAESAPRTVSLGLFRDRIDGTLLCLADRVPSGTGVTDPYPPLDRALRYTAVAYTENGLTARTEASAVVPSGGAAFVNFGAHGLADVAKVAMDLEWSTDVEVDSEIVETEGDADPLVFFGTAKRASCSVSGNVWRTPEAVPEGWGDAACTAPAFERLAEDDGVKVVRFPRGPVMAVHATCKVSASAANGLVSAVELNGRRVRAHGLVL